jgi:hypothetical protein
VFGLPRLADGPSADGVPGRVSKSSPSCGIILQALIPDTGFGSPYAVDAVAAQYTYWISARSRRCSESVPPLIALWDAIREALFGGGFDFASVLQDECICTVLVERGATFDSLEADDAGVMCEERVDPPAAPAQSARRS